MDKGTCIILSVSLIILLCFLSVVIGDSDLTREVSSTGTGFPWGWLVLAFTALMLLAGCIVAAVLIHRAQQAEPLLPTHY